MNVLSTSLYELLADNLPLRSNKVVIEDPSGSYSYQDLSVQVDFLASKLNDQNIKPGERIVVHLRKSVSEVIAMFAVAKIGAVIVNVNVQLTAGQLDYIANDCEARCIIMEKNAAISFAKRDKPEKVDHIFVNGVAPDDDLFSSWLLSDCCITSSNSEEAKIPPVTRLDNDLAMIIYTSGSTGNPKGVMISHLNLLAGARSVARYLKLEEGDRLLSVLPYSFDYGLNQLLTMMLVGGTIIHQAVPMAAEIVKSLKERNITGLAAVPPLWSQIVNLLDSKPENFPCLKRITNSGGKISPKVLEKMPAAFSGVDIYLMYGLTEAFRSTFLQPNKFIAKMGSMGKAIPGAEVYVIKHGVGVAAPREHGELVHRGSLVSMGYWALEAKTAEKIKPCSELFHLIGEEPVVYSGDIVYADEDGDLWFVGRNDAMIKTSGFRVSPEEVEDIVYKSGMVTEAVAFGVENDELGQVVNISVLMQSDYDKDALKKYCRKAMPPYMIPATIHIWPVPMPRTSSGKLSRPEIVKASLEGDQQ